MRTIKSCIVASVVLQLCCSSASILDAHAQEAKRPERMEGALGTDSSDDKIASTQVEHTAVLPGLLPNGQVQLHNQWSLDPAGKHLLVGDFPVNIAIRRGGAVAAVLHSGQGTHEVITVDMKKHTVIARVTLPQSFYGLCFSPDGSRLYASGGEFDLVHSWNVDAEGLLSGHAQLKIVSPAESFVVSGMTLSKSGDELFVCGAWGAKLASMNTASPSDIRFLELPKGSYPYASVLSSDSKSLYVSLWGASSVAVVDLGSWSVKSTWQTPSHPTEMVLSPDGTTMYVA